MKKFLLAILCVMFLICGCYAEKIKNEVTEGVEDVKDEVSEMMPQETTDTQSSPDNMQFIGEDKAKEIALKKAGLSIDGVTFDRVELEKDDGAWQYEIEFRKDKTEYNADISAKDGKVISWEIDTE